MTPRELAISIIDCVEGTIRHDELIIQNVEVLITMALNEAYREALQDLEKNRFRNTGGPLKA